MKSTVLDMFSLTFNSDRKRKSKQDIHVIQISEKCTPNVHTFTWTRNTATDSCPLVQMLSLSHIVISDTNNRPAISNAGEGCEHICTEPHAHTVSLHISKPVVDGDNRIYNHCTLSACFHMHMQSHTCVSKATPLQWEWIQLLPLAKD